MIKVSKRFYDHNLDTMSTKWLFDSVLCVRMSYVFWMEFSEIGQAHHAHSKHQTLCLFAIIEAITF